MSKSKKSMTQQLADFEASYIKFRTAKEKKEQDEWSKRGLRARILGLFLKNQKLLVKENISLADLPPLAAEHTAKHLHNEIQKTIEGIFNRQSKYMKEFKRVSNVFGMYDTIIGLIIRKDVWNLKIIELIQGLLLSAFIGIFVFKLEPILKLQEIEFGQIWYKFFINFVILTLSSFTRVWIERIEERIRLTIRRSLSQLIFEKLSMSDQYFLEHADNNMIYKLMYLEADDYCRYLQNWASIIPVATIIMALVGMLLVQPPSNGYLLVLMIVILKLLLNYIIEIIKRKYYLNSKHRAFEQRKLFYEFIYSFKSFTLKNLKKKYFNTIGRVSDLELQTLKNYHFVSVQGRKIHKFSISFILLIGPIIMWSTQNQFNGGKLECCGTYMFYLVVFFCLEDVMRKSINQISYWLYYKSSKEVFDKFFDNDFIIQDANEPNPEMKPGEIQIRNCDILERDKQHLKETIDFIMKNGNSAVDLSREQLKLGGTSQFRPSTADRNLLKASAVDGTLPMNRLKPVCSKLNLDISPGSRICIYENGNHETIQGVLRILQRENSFVQGEALICGSISYFNPHKMKLLAGKTIRDNIIFGEEFQKDRFEDLLKFLEIDFSNYIGQEMHQVSENGGNIKRDDIKLILLARFLYKNSDIYIIDGFLSEPYQSITLGFVKPLFKRWLQGKTIIYIASDIDLLKLSDQILLFESPTVYHEFNTRQFLESLEQGGGKVSSKKSLLEVVDDRNKNHSAHILRIKKKNAVFVGSLSYEEELKIFKEVKQRKQDIEKMKAQNLNIMELLVYGIYLSAQKRKQGETVEDFLSNDKTFFSSLILETFGGEKNKWWNIVLVALLHLIPLIFFVSAESTAFHHTREFDPAGQEGGRDFDGSSQAVIWMVAMLGGSYLFDEVKDWYLQRMFTNVTKRGLNEVRESILSSEIKSILNKKSHDMLNCINRDLLEISINFPHVLRNLLRYIADVFSSILILSYTLSLWPAVVITLALVFNRLIVEYMIPSYKKIFELSFQARNKLDDFHFELLSRVVGYRIAGNISKLHEKYCNLQDSLTKSTLVEKFEYGSFAYSFLQTVMCILFLFLNFCFILNLSFPKFNFIHGSKATIIWSVVNIFRLIKASQTIPLLLLEFVYLNHNYARLKCFLQKQKIVRHSEWTILMNSMLDIQSPIIFRNVSMTMGLQPVLKKLNFKIKPNTRVAFVGIDGGGRSTIFELITNIIARDKSEDSEINLFNLRIEHLDEEVIKDNIFLIERNPTLFAATLRENLDPFFKQTDDAILKMLNLWGVSLLIRKQDVCSMTDKLNKRDQKIYLERRISMLDKLQNANSQNISTPKQNFSIEMKSPSPSNKLSPLGRLLSRGGSKVELLPKPALMKSRITKKKEGAEKNSKHQAEKNKVLELKRGAQQLVKIEMNRLIPLIKGTKSPDSIEKKIEDLQLDKPHVTPRESEKSIKTVKKDHQFQLVSSLRPIKNGSESNLNLDHPPTSPRRTYSKHVSLDLLAAGKGKDKDKQEASERISESKLSRELRSSSELSNQIQNAEKALGLESAASELDSSVVFQASREEIISFLNMRASFEGKNIHPEVKKLLMFCRVCFEKPKILLIYEDSLEFGRGIACNLETLKMSLPKSTILCITKYNINLLLFDKAIFIDGGKVLEKGDPKQLLEKEASYLFRFVRDTDEIGLELLKEKLQHLKEQKEHDKLKLPETGRPKIESSDGEGPIDPFDKLDPPETPKVAIDAAQTLKAKSNNFETFLGQSISKAADSPEEGRKPKISPMNFTIEGELNQNTLKPDQLGKDLTPSYFDKLDLSPISQDYTASPSHRRKGATSSSRYFDMKDINITITEPSNFNPPGQTNADSTINQGQTTLARKVPMFTTDSFLQRNHLSPALSYSKDAQSLSRNWNYDSTGTPINAQRPPSLAKMLQEQYQPALSLIPEKSYEEGLSEAGPELPSKSRLPK